MDSHPTRERLHINAKTQNNPLQISGSLSQYGFLLAYALPIKLQLLQVQQTPNSVSSAKENCCALLMFPTLHYCLEMASYRNQGQS